MKYLYAETTGNVLMDPQAVDLIRLIANDEQAAWQLFCTRSSSFTDCTSFALMRHLGLRTAAALNDDFRVEEFWIVP